MDIYLTELANIIAGNAKKDLFNLNVSISLPNVVIGKNHQIACPSDVKSFVVPFTSEIGNLVLEVSLKTL